MSFTHVKTGMTEHKHETVAEARLCEQGRRTITTVTAREEKGGVPTYREAQHESPCVCGAYDQCWEFRVAKASRTGNWRDLYRAYND